MLPCLALLFSLLVARRPFLVAASTSTLSGHGNKRSLAAATQKPDLQTRSDTIHAGYHAHLVYADSTTSKYDIEPFVATVSVSSQMPILVLEHFDHLLDDVHCDSGTITITKAFSARHWGRETIDHLLNGHIITAHGGCNTDYGRLPYRILDIDHVSNESVVFSTVPVVWRDTFDTFEINMGYNSESHELLHHWRRRQDIWEKRTPDGSSPSSFNPSAMPTIADPTPGPTSTSTAHLFDIAGSVTGSSVGPADDASQQIKCVDCTTFGQVDVTFMSFQWVCGLDPPSDISGCLHGGATLTTHGMGAHIDMSATLSESFDFNIPIHELPTNFQISIPGLGSANVVFANTLHGGITLNRNVEISYGLDLSVPDGSSINLDVVHASDSTYSGFDSASITPMPFQVHDISEKIEAYIALQAVVKAGFGFDEHFDTKGDLSGGLYINLPLLSADINPVKDVDMHCNPLSEGSTTSTSAVAIDFSAGWSFGAFLDADLTILGKSLIHSDHDIEKNDSFPIGSVCVDYMEGSMSEVGTAGTGSGSGRTSPGGEENGAAPGIGSKKTGLMICLLLISSMFSML